MAIVLDTNMRLFADRLDISTKRMSDEYGLKTVNEIIKAEAAQGNYKAVQYARQMYGSPDKLISIYKLTSLDNKFIILKNLSEKERLELLELLDQEDLLMGLYFFTTEKILALLEKVDTKELVKVILETFPLTKIIEMLPEEELAQFLGNDKLEKDVIMEQIKNLPPDIMKLFIEGVTGQPFEEINQADFFNSIESLSDDKFKKFIESIDPEVQRQITFQLTKEQPDYLEFIQNKTYVEMMSTLLKEDIIKPMICLKKDSLIKMISNLPPEMMSIVCTQIDTRKFAYYLLDGHLNVLKHSMMI